MLNDPNGGVETSQNVRQYLAPVQDQTPRGMMLPVPYWKETDYNNSLSDIIEQEISELAADFYHSTI